MSAKTFKLPPPMRQIEIIGHGFRTGTDRQQHPMSVRIDGYEFQSGAIRLRNLQTVPAPWLVSVSAGAGR